jgi:acyl carrier protein
MSAEEVAELVRLRVSEMAPTRPQTIDRDTRPIVDLGYDSLRLVELASALEDDFDLEAGDDDDVTDIETVGDIEDRVLAMLAEAGRVAS